MKVVIVGGGKVGYYLAKTLLEHGHDIELIEINKQTCASIANELDIPVICGDSTQIETLEAASLEDADAIICVSGMDEVNLITCQLAKKTFGVAKTIAKVNNPKNAIVLKELGVDNVINSTDSIASLIEREVDTSKIKELISLNHGEAVICEVTLPEKYYYDGKQLMDIKLPGLFNIVSITRGNTLIIPRGQSVLRSGDKLLVISDSDEVKMLRSVLKLKD
ncbi:MAG: TrkA family potassium uptake protein [Ruminococcus sp.]|nr:TrkA family potassium uptake protein [Ruminococcus sp.]